jgi:hypothetical protein
VKAVQARSLLALGEPGLVYHPGPGIGEHAWQRAVNGGHAAWSLCGITHTTSSAGAMDALAQLITAPVQPRDAVICTSTAALLLQPGAPGSSAGHLGVAQWTYALAGDAGPPASG